LWAAVRQSSSLLDRHLEAEAVTRTDIHYSLRGERLGTTERNEQTLHTVETHLSAYTGGRAVEVVVGLLRVIF
jgi:hypothetical protein